jgi:hypothetical protein
MINTWVIEAFTSFYMKRTAQIRKETPNRLGLSRSFASRRWFRDRSADDKEA